MSQNWVSHFNVMVTSAWLTNNMRAILGVLIATLASTVKCGYHPAPSTVLELPKIHPASSGYSQSYAAQYVQPHVSAAGVALTIPGRTAPYILVQGNQQYVSQYRAQQNYYNSLQNKENSMHNLGTPHNQDNQYQVQHHQLVVPMDIYSEHETVALPPATGVQPPNLRPAQPQPIPIHSIPIVSKPVEIQHGSYVPTQRFPATFLPEVSAVPIRAQPEPIPTTPYVQSPPFQPPVPVYYGFHPIVNNQAGASAHAQQSTIITHESHPELIGHPEPKSPDHIVSYTISNNDNQFIQEYKNSRPPALDIQQNGGIISNTDSIRGSQVDNLVENHEGAFSQSLSNDQFIDHHSHQNSKLIENYNNIPSDASYNTGYVRPATEPLVTKHIYVHVPPPDADEAPAVVAPPPPPKKTYNIIFLKVPSQESYNGQRILNQLRNQQAVEEKTLIYVLVKKPETKVASVGQVKPPSKPEVFFVKYKGDSDAEEEQLVQNTHSVTHQTDFNGEA